MSMAQVVGQALKGSAAHAVMLLGVLPVYVAVALGLVIFQADPLAVEGWLTFGLVLPFVTGLWGMRSIYRGVLLFADTLPPERRCRRTCFLRRLVLSWSAVYAAVSPVMIYRLWEYFAGVIG
jgi:hypothetical protein